MKQKWFIIDFNYIAGCDIIYTVDVSVTTACKIENRPGWKLVLTNGDVIYVDQDSAFLTFDLAKELYRKKIERMQDYAKDFKINDKILNNNISIVEKQ